MSNESKNPLSILTPNDFLWFGRWLSDKQILEGINSWTSDGGSLPTEAKLGTSRSVIFDVLEAARRRVESGLPSVWQSLGRALRRRGAKVHRSFQEASGVLQGLKPNASSKRSCKRR